MSLVKQRRQEMAAVEDAPLPTIIFDDEAPPIYDEVNTRLKGTPTSRGYYSGPVRVIRNTGESDKLRQGDVLVIPFSDVGWTPLFTKAGAVISGSGGLLSHSSIIAREYGIPAVVSVPGALELKDGTLVAVDGYTGKIAIQEEST
jgi:pyruvate,water dikinase